MPPFTLADAAQIVLPPKLAYARHDAFMGATFLFADAALTRRMGWQNGFLADGAIIEDAHFQPMRVVLVGAAQAQAAA